MKKLFFVFVAFLFCLTLSAQDRLTDNTEFYEFTVDTANDAESIYFTYPNMLDGLYYYSWQIVADSLSGTTVGTCYLQESNTRAGTAYESLSGKTLTIDGVQSSTVLTGTVYGARQRLKCTTSGTQSTKISVYLAFKKINSR